MYQTWHVSGILFQDIRWGIVVELPHKLGNDVLVKVNSDSEWNDPVLKKFLCKMCWGWLIYRHSLYQFGIYMCYDQKLKILLSCHLQGTKGVYCDELQWPMLGVHANEGCCHIYLRSGTSRALSDYRRRFFCHVWPVVRVFLYIVIFPGAPQSMIGATKTICSVEPMRVRIHLWRRRRWNFVLGNHVGLVLTRNSNDRFGCSGLAIFMVSIFACNVFFCC